MTKASLVNESMKCKEDSPGAATADADVTITSSSDSSSDEDDLALDDPDMVETL